MVRVADCVPVLLADPSAQACSEPRTPAATGLRRGRRRGLRRADARPRAPTGSSAWVGPHICGSCYEVPEALQQRGGGRRAGDSLSTTSWGTPALDIGAGRHAPSSSASGVAVHDVSRCTLESPDLYSHRRDGAGAGRFAGVIRMTRHERRATRRDRGRACAAVRERIDHGLRRTRAASADEITLVVVTKFFPASDVRLLADLGVRDVGENRHQEAVEKAAECADLDVSLALHRRAAEQQGGGRRGVRRRGALASTAPSWSAA